MQCWFIFNATCLFSIESIELFSSTPLREQYYVKSIHNSQPDHIFWEMFSGDSILKPLPQTKWFGRLCIVVMFILLNSVCKTYQSPCDSFFHDVELGYVW